MVKLKNVVNTNIISEGTKMIIKKGIFIVGVIGILCCVVGCGSSEVGKENTEVTQNSEILQETETESETEIEIKIEIADAQDILRSTWYEYKTGELFKIMGGHFSSPLIGLPAKYDLTQTTDLMQMYCVPESHFSVIDDAATMVDFNNAARFTAGAYHVTDANNMQIMADDIKKQVVENQWHGEKPEKLLVLKIDEQYIVSVYGRENYVDLFKQKLESVYKKMIEVMVEEKIF